MTPLGTGLGAFTRALIAGGLLSHRRAARAHDGLARWQSVYPAGALAVPAALGTLRGRLGRGPLVAALRFGGTLAPALGFFNIYRFIYSFVTDHFQCLASLGLITLAAALIAMRPDYAPGYSKVGGVYASQGNSRRPSPPVARRSPSSPTSRPPAPTSAQANLQISGGPG